MAKRIIEEKGSIGKYFQKELIVAQPVNYNHDAKHLLLLADKIKINNEENCMLITKCCDNLSLEHWGKSKRYRLLTKE